MLQVQNTASDVNKIVDGFTDDIKDPDQDVKKPKTISAINGSSLVHKSMIERKYLIDKKLRRKSESSTFYKV